MKRRTFIKNGLTALTLAGALGPSALIRSAFADTFSLPLFVQSLIAARQSRHQRNFNTDLPIPPLLINRDTTRDSANFSLSVDRGKVEFFPGQLTETLGYNGNFLGPTIRVRTGQRFRLAVQNTLVQETTLHLHGMHLPAQWDGGPRQPIAPGTTWTPEFTVRQQAATLWYHPHAMGLTGEQVYHGLAGMVFVEDEYSDTLDIPKTYGVDDIPLIIQDRRFSTGGQFIYVQNRQDVINGVIGNSLLINGVRQPTLRVPGQLVRLRLLNGSNSSIYTLGFGDHRTFHVIATDGGFLETPAAMNTIVLSAGERAEILVDFSAGGTSLQVDLLDGTQFPAMQISTDDQQRQASSAHIPRYLRPFNRIPATESVRTRKFTMETTSMSMGRGGGRESGEGRLTINGKAMDINRIDERIKLGDTEIWEITNRSSMMTSLPHSMHLHDVQFQILSRNGYPPPPHEQGRKDTVLIMPGETVRIISRFHDYPGVYMYHCHLLEHEDDGMMGQFEVVI